MICFAPQKRSVSFLLLLLNVLGLTFTSCSLSKKSAQSKKNIFVLISSERESWTSPIPNGKSGYDYFIKLVTKKTCQIHFDSLILSSEIMLPVKVLKGKELYFGTDFSVNDTLIIRATELTDS